MSEPADSRHPDTDPTGAPAPRRVRERREPLRATAGSRVLSALIALACLTVLSVGAWLTPLAEGHGTHTALGLRPCMWAATLDKPCITCGMTTSFAEAGEGRWARSFLTQPMGALLVVVTTVVFWGALAQAVSGARVSVMVQPALRPKVFLAWGVLLLLAWVYKVITW